MRLYAEVRRDIMFVRWDQEDGGAIAPSLWSGTRRARRRAEPAALAPTSAPPIDGGAAPMPRPPRATAPERSGIQSPTQSPIQSQSRIQSPLQSQSPLRSRPLIRLAASAPASTATPASPPAAPPTRQTELGRAR